MPGNFAWVLTLAVFSGFSMNLILRFGIGLQQIAMEENTGDSEKNAERVFLIRPGILFISIMLLWLFFSCLQSVLFLGFLEYILIFPVSSLFFIIIEYLARRLVLKTNNRFISDYFFINGSDADQPSFNGMAGGGASIGGAPPGGAPTGGALTGTALFIILGLAGSFAQAAVLSFGFAAGYALAVLIAGEIRRRSAMEAVPDCLRGGPLVLVAMGLLSLVFISAAAVFYAVLGVN